MILITGADDTHGRSLIQLLASVRRHEPSVSVIVYDLGLNPERVMQARMLHCAVRRFAFERYPSYFDIKKNAGEFAWKPTIVAEVASEHPGLVLWMDAGNVVERPLVDIEAQLRTSGFCSSSSGGTVRRWCHPGMLDFLGTDGLDLSSPNFDASCVGFNTDDERAKDLLAEWARLAAVRACIAPAGSDRTNHRQDQALLTVLAYKRGFVPRPLVAVKAHQDIDPPRPRASGRWWHGFARRSLRRVRP